jgi:hypothetical protein
VPWQPLRASPLGDHIALVRQHADGSDMRDLASNLQAIEMPRIGDSVRPGHPRRPQSPTRTAGNTVGETDPIAKANRLAMR